MTDTATAQKAQTALFAQDFLWQLLEHFFNGAIEAKINAEVPAVTRNLDGHGHGFPLNPTDADKDAFTRHCVRQFFKVATKGGFPADLGRDFFAPRVAPKVRGQLTAGKTTQMAVQEVGSALLLDIESFEP